MTCVGHLASSYQVGHPGPSEPQGKEEESSVHPSPAHPEVPRAQGLGSAVSSLSPGLSHVQAVLGWSGGPLPHKPSLELLLRVWRAPARRLQSVASSRTEGAPWEGTKVFMAVPSKNRDEEQDTRSHCVQFQPHEM